MKVIYKYFRLSYTAIDVFQMFLFSKCKLMVSCPFSIFYLVKKVGQTHNVKEFINIVKLPPPPPPFHTYEKCLNDAMRKSYHSVNSTKLNSNLTKTQFRKINKNKSKQERLVKCYSAKKISLKEIALAKKFRQNEIWFS